MPPVTPIRPVEPALDNSIQTPAVVLTSQENLGEESTNTQHHLIIDESPEDPNNQENHQEEVVSDQVTTTNKEISHDKQLGEKDVSKKDAGNQENHEMTRSDSLGEKDTNLTHPTSASSSTRYPPIPFTIPIQPKIGAIPKDVNLFFPSPLEMIEQFVKRNYNPIPGTSSQHGMDLEQQVKNLTSEQTQELLNAIVNTHSTVTHKTISVTRTNDAPNVTNHGTSSQIFKPPPPTGDQGTGETMENTRYNMRPGYDPEIGTRRSKISQEKKKRKEQEKNRNPINIDEEEGKIYFLKKFKIQNFNSDFLKK